MQTDSGISSEENVKLKAKVFESSMRSWEDLCSEVSDFADGIGPDCLVNVSMASSGGGDWSGLGSLGTIIVWYWDKEP